MRDCLTKRARSIASEKLPDQGARNRDCLPGTREPGVVRQVMAQSERLPVQGTRELMIADKE